MKNRVYSLIITVLFVLVESCATKDDGPDIDVSPPTIPSNLTVNEVTTNTIELSWSDSSDDIAVTGYSVYINDQIINNTDQTNFILTDLTPQTSYNIGVSAFDAAANSSEINYIQTITKAPKELAGTTEFYASNTGLEGYIMVDDARNDRVFLMNTSAEIIYEWDIPSGIGNDVELLENGQLLGIMKDENANQDISFGGYGGKLQFVRPDSSVEWNFDISTDELICHHDVELLPNGNVITLVWEQMSVEEATEAGSDLNLAIVPEAVVEINPTTNEIVWEWHAKDHLIQDYDETKSNYGVIANHPRKINVNYVGDRMEDIMHANGLEYDTEEDLIYISVNFYSEVWVIDHSTTTEEAATESGGNKGFGGDLVYRFGNPEAYDNIGARLFYNNHHPVLFNSSEGKTLSLFMNGYNIEQSTVYEFDFDQSYSLETNTDNEPAVRWSFTHPDLYAAKVSGIVRLPNNNRLITEGDYGIWEVSPDGNVIWKFSGNGFYWRSYYYDKNHPGIIALGL